VADSLPPGRLRAQRELLQQEAQRLARRASELGIAADDVHKLLDEAFEKLERQRAAVAAKGGSSQ
jgi:hypothetical protein